MMHPQSSWSLQHDGSHDRSARQRSLTGAALGIGRAMSNRFAEAGMLLVAADLPGEELDRTVDALKAISPRGPDAILEAPTGAGSTAARHRHGQVRQGQPLGQQRGDAYRAGT
jgi:NAD(P)-dependent dehydrogenase (short-subunit alcohol dehydrogenase family)